MAWCHQATSHYLNKCWPRSMSLYGVTRPRWVKDYSHIFPFELTDPTWGWNPMGVLSVLLDLCTEKSPSRYICSTEGIYCRWFPCCDQSHDILYMERISALLGSLCGESTSHQWILLTKEQNFNVSFMMLAWTSSWTNSPGAGDLRYHNAHVTSLECFPASDHCRPSSGNALIFTPNVRQIFSQTAVSLQSYKHQYFANTHRYAAGSPFQTHMFIQIHWVLSLLVTKYPTGRAFSGFQF